MCSKLTKAEWRAKARAIIKGHALDVSLGHVPLILDSSEFKAANLVALYLSMPTEPITEPLINAALNLGKRVAIPIYDYNQKVYMWGEYLSGAELVEARFGILEPKEVRKINPLDIDVCYLPGLLFDKKGVRLGHGGGFYDRLLIQLSPDALILGVAFPWQLVEELPFEEHDILCNKVITQCD